jgi:crotonobetainyl-CoA:carnitine CoA-transferase CaiB-like acyl-CoA transferase
MTEEGRRVINQLIGQSDVIVHNMRPKAASKLGLDYEAVRKVNPRIIHCCASGYSEQNSNSDEPAVDDTIQAATGLANLLGQSFQEPAYAPFLIVDKVAGLLLTQAVLAGLLSRERNGQGVSVKIPMYESLAAFNLIEHLGGYAFQPAHGPIGYDRLLNPGRKPMRTKDGYIGITPYSALQWRKFFAFVGRPEMTDDPRIINPQRRYEALPELYAMVEAILPTRTSEEWLRAAQQLGIPAARVKSLEDVALDPELAEQNYLFTASHESEGEVVGVGPLIRLDEAAGVSPRLAPRLGQDTREVMLNIGLSPEHINELEERKVLLSS